jgi:Predicted membrane protein (DUF2142)
LELCPQMMRRLMFWFRSDLVAARAHAALFVLLALPLGIVLTALVPLGQVPDERAHVMRAESLWYGELMGHIAPALTDNGSVWPRGGVITDLSILQAAETNLPSSARKVTTDSHKAARAIPWQAGPMFVALGSISGYFPVFYVPAAVAMGIVRLAGFGPYNAAITGRCLNLMIYIGLGAIALLTTRRGRSLMLATLLLPISLFLAASLSEDGLFLAASCLAAALMTRVWEAPLARRRLLWVAAGLIGCLALTKPPYLPIVALLLVPFPRACGWRTGGVMVLSRLAGVLIIAALTVAWLSWAAHDVTAPFWSQPGDAGLHEPGPLWPGSRPTNIQAVDQAAQATVLRSRPSLLLTLPAQTLVSDARRWRELIGVLGPLKIVLPAAFYLVWIVAAGVALVADLTTLPRATQLKGWLEAFFLLAACVASIFAIYLSQYISWTPVGAEYIEGPQGRYLLPLIPILAVALPRFILAGGGPIRSAALLVLAAVGGIGIFVIPTAIVAFYYMAP